MRKLPVRKRRKEHPPDVLQKDRAVGRDAIADRVLHPRVGGNDEEAREPGARADHHAGPGDEHRRQAAPPIKQSAEKHRLEKERKHALHRERLTDNRTGVARKGRPVRSELKLHWNAGDDAGGKVDRKDLRPEVGNPRGLFIAFARRLPGVRSHERRKPHRSDRKEVMEHDREGKLQPIDEHGISAVASRLPRDHELRSSSRA